MFHCAVLTGNGSNALELIGLIIVFILILFATYYTSRWVAKNGVNLQHSGNIEIVETYRLSQTKYLQIIKVGQNRYFLISVAKENVSFISEIKEEDIDLTRYINQKNQNNDFSDVLKKMLKKNK